jgi:hypothetical protein
VIDDGDLLQRQRCVRGERALDILEAVLKCLEAESSSSFTGIRVLESDGTASGHDEGPGVAVISRAEFERLRRMATNPMEASHEPGNHQTQE